MTFPLEDGDPGTPFYGAHADRDGSESREKELHSYLAAVVDWPEDAVQEVARLRAEVERLRVCFSLPGAEFYAGTPAWNALARAERAESNARGKQAVIEAQRATLDRVRAHAKVQAIACHAMGHSDQERNWLDVLIILDAPQPEAATTGGESGE